MCTIFQEFWRLVLIELSIPRWMKHWRGLLSLDSSILEKEFMPKSNEMGVGGSCALYGVVTFTHGTCPGKLWMVSCSWAFPSPILVSPRSPVFHFSSCQESILWYCMPARLNNAPFLNLIETSHFTLFPIYKRETLEKTHQYETVRRFKK